METLLKEKKMMKAAGDLKIKAKSLKDPLEENYESMLNKFVEEIVNCSKRG